MHYNVIVTAEIKQSLARPVQLAVPEPMNELLEDLMTSKTKIVSEGILRSTRDGRITLSFRSENGLENVISFSKKDPELISICREDTVFENANTLFLEEGKRHKCIGRDKNGEPVEFAVNATRVFNRLLKLGKMNLEYSVEICGVRAETLQISLNVVHDAAKE